MTEKERLLAEAPIGRLLVKMSVPAMIAMVVNALYNLVDTIFVGRGVGPLGIAGLTIAFPLQIFVMAVAMMVGIGSASVVSRALGARDRDRAADAAGTAIGLALILSVAVVAIAYAFLEPMLVLFGATPDILPYAKEYVEVVLLGTVFLSMAMSSNNVIRAEGQAKWAMAVMVVGAGANIILDPIFIFALGMGIRGAALATVIGQGLAFVVAMSFFLSKKSALPLRLKSLVPRPRVLRDILPLGIPAFVRQVGGTILAVLVNNALRTHGGNEAELYIASFGTINRLLVFALMPLFGIAQGFQPIAGYNFGAGRFSRVRQVLKKAAGVSTVIAAFFFLLFMLIPGLLLQAFTDDTRLLEIGREVMRVIVLVVPLVGFQVVGATYFQALGKAIPAFFLSLSRQVIFLIPLIATLPPILGVQGVWISFPIADVLAALVTGLWLAYSIRRMPRQDTPVEVSDSSDPGLAAAVAGPVLTRPAPASASPRRPSHGKKRGTSRASSA